MHQSIKLLKKICSKKKLLDVYGVKHRDHKRINKTQQRVRYEYTSGQMLETSNEGSKSRLSQAEQVKHYLRKVEAQVYVIGTCDVEYVTNDETNPSNVYGTSTQAFKCSKLIMKGSKRSAVSTKKMPSSKNE